jgi:molybdopterin biosynthesis enzyme
LKPRGLQQRPSRLTPLAEVEGVIDAISPTGPREVELGAALGRVLAADVIVPAPVPPAAVALRDGWAVASDQVVDAGPYAPVPLAPRWVDAGDPLPRGTDAVLPPDAVAAEGGVTQALAPAAPGEAVLPAGGDVAQDEVLLRAGERLRALDLALLRAAGVARVKVRIPRVRLFIANPLIDAVDDTIGLLIARVVERGGGEVIIERAALGVSLREVLKNEEADATIVVGGTGEGRRDASVRTVAEVGRVLFHGIAIRPGESAAFGTGPTRPVLLLPGRLDAALTAWLLIGNRLFARLAGARGDEVTRSFPLVRKAASAIGLAEVVPVGQHEGGVVPLAFGHLPLRALARAVGWIRIPAESEGCPAGSMVEVRAFP